MFPVSGDEDAGAFLRAFGKRLRLARLDRGLTQEEFARLLGVHRTFYGALERGDRGCNIARLPDFCRALGVSVDALLPGERVP